MGEVGSSDLRLSSDLLIGDINIDPSRWRGRDQRPLAILEEAGWRPCPADGGWSCQRDDLGPKIQ